MSKFYFMNSVIIQFNKKKKTLFVQSDLDHQKGIFVQWDMKSVNVQSNLKKNGSELSPSCRLLWQNSQKKATLISQHSAQKAVTSL